MGTGLFGLESPGGLADLARDFSAFNPFPAAMILRRLLPLLAALLLAAACSREGGVTGSEQEDADFLRAQELKGRGLMTEALAAYLKVIARRGELAPESYLDAGLIYYQANKDPFKGWYYMQQYLVLQPNSPRREQVRQQVAAAEREALLQRLAQSQFGGGELVQLQEQVDQLAKENLRLEAELKMLRESPITTMTRSESLLAPSVRAATPIIVGGAAATGTLSSPITPSPAGGAGTPAIVFSLPGAAQAAPATAEGAAPTVAKGPGPQAQKGAAPVAKAASPAAAARSHTVKARDTLSTIARQYYNGDASSARLNALRQANREVLKNGDALAVGMTLRIP
jgi:LysM repeat protein